MFKRKMQGSIVIGNLCCLLAVIVVFAGLLSGFSNAQAATPSVRFEDGAEITPSDALSYYGSPTSPAAKPIAELDPRITELARALRHDPDIIHEYMRSNIEFEPMFGLQGGAVRAILDERGTAFDQAQLMVDLLRASSISARYKLGQITLTGQEFEDWFGVSNTDYARDLLADGAIPATVSGSSTISQVTFLHVWVEANIGGSWYAFDPSRQVMENYTSIDISAAAGYADVSFYSTVIAGMSTGTQSMTDWVSGIDEQVVKTEMRAKSISLLNNIRTNHADKRVEEVFGGHVLTSYEGGVLRDSIIAGQAVVNATWSGKIPDIYRTTLRIQVLGIDETFFADDIYGARMTFRPKKWGYGRPSFPDFFYQSLPVNEYVLYVGHTSLSELDETVSDETKFKVATTTWTEEEGYAGQIIFTIDHPYAANSGGYADETIKKKPAAGYTDIVFSLGKTTSVHAEQYGLAAGRYPSRYEFDAGKICDVDAAFGGSILPPGLSGFNGDVINLLGPATENCVADNNANYENEPTLNHYAALVSDYDITARRWLAHVSSIAELMEGIEGKSIQQHHSIGLAASIDAISTLVGPSSAGLDIETLAGISDDGSDANRSNAVKRSFATYANHLEGTPLKNNLIGNTPSSYLFSRAAEGKKIYEIDALNYAQNASGHDADELEKVEAYVNDGYSVLISEKIDHTCQFPNWPRGFYEQSNADANSGTFSCGADNIKFLVAFKAGSDSIAHVFPYRDYNATGGDVFYYRKGSSLLRMRGDYDHINVGLDRSIGGIVRNVDQSSGDVSLNMPADLIDGMGDYPYSLPFQRSYNSGRKNNMPIGRGWVHNFDQMVSLNDSTADLMGERSPLHAVPTIMALKASIDVAAHGDDIENWILLSTIASWWDIGRGDNSATIVAGASGERFTLLVDGTWDSPGSASKLSDTGSWSPDMSIIGDTKNYANLGFTYTTPSNAIATFSRLKPTVKLSRDGHPIREFFVQSWSYPYGVDVTFDYRSATGTLEKVSNNLGRYLDFEYEPTTSCSEGTLPDQSSVGACQNILSRWSELLSVSDSAGNKIEFDLGTTPALNDNRVQLLMGVRHTHFGLSSSAKRQVYGYDQGKLTSVHWYEADPTTATADISFSYDTFDGRVLGRGIGAIDKTEEQTFYHVTRHRGEVVDPEGVNIISYFDDRVRATRIQDALGNEQNIERDGLGRVVKQIAPEGQETSYIYDTNHNVIETRVKAKSGSSEPDIVVKTQYDVASATNNLQWSEDALGNRTDFTYFSSGLLKDATGPAVDGVRPVSSFTYDSFGQLLTEIDPTGIKACFTYDAANHYVPKEIKTSCQTGGFNFITALAVDNIGNVTAVDGPRTDVTDVANFVYDDLRRLTAVSEPLGATSQLTFNDKGFVTQTQSATGNPGDPWAVTNYIYDLAGRPTKVTDPDGHITETFYDSAGRPLVTVDAEGRQTRTVYDDLGRPAKVIRAWAGLTDGTGATLDCDQMRADTTADPTQLQQCYQQYTYTANGQIATVKDAGGNITNYDYDGFDRLIRTCFPDKTTAGVTSTTDCETYAYDAVGNITAKITRRGYNNGGAATEQIDFIYDALNRLTQRTVPNSAGTGDIGTTKEDYDFTYDLAGRRLTGVHWLTTQAYAYDGAGRLSSLAAYITTTPANKMVTAYEYDAGGNRTKLTYPDGYYVSHTYDALNRATRTCENITAAACETAATPLAEVSYDALSRRAGLDYGNGTSASYAFTTRGDLTDHDWAFAGAAAANYDFTYNGVGQLLTETVSDLALEWLPAMDGVDAYAANGLNQYTDIDGSSPAYDGNGNITTDISGRTYRYSAENELIEIRDAQDARIGLYAYNADGTRRWKSGGPASRFYHDGDQEILETDNAGGGANITASNVTRRYIRMPGSVDETFLMIDYTLDASCTNTSAANCKVWAHQNRLGSTVATTDDSGAIIDRYTYSPYGESDDATGFPFRFTGQKLDAETGLYYYKARYYDPETGRFLQTDPIGYEDQMNLYGYVGNDPVNGTDPSGQDSITCVTVDDGEAQCLRVKELGPDEFSLTHEGETRERISRKRKFGGNGDSDVADIASDLFKEEFGIDVDVTIISPRDLENARQANINQMNQAIARGQAPRGIRRVDRGAVRGEQDHVHLRDGRALNRDGSWKHNSSGDNRITNAQREWLKENGWTPPPE